MEVEPKSGGIRQGEGPKKKKSCRNRKPEEENKKLQKIKICALAHFRNPCSLGRAHKTHIKGVGTKEKQKECRDFEKQKDG